MKKSKDIDERLLKSMYKSGRGIPTMHGKVYYPKKARSCKNCYLAIINWSTLVTTGCEYFEVTNKDGKQKPKGLCIPVRSCSDMDEIYATEIHEWILRNLLITRDE